MQMTVVDSLDPCEEFRPAWWLRGGHRQTLWAALQKPPDSRLPTIAHRLTLRDGDVAFLHEDIPETWRPGDPSLLLMHGLCGCHASSYMVRFAKRFFYAGTRTYRLDMRGCGAASDYSNHLTHAGRSDDVLDALRWIEARTEQGPMWAIGVSMGGNQLLRAVGRRDAGIGLPYDGLPRVVRIAAVAPPIDLVACSRNMQRAMLRPYNWYFIRKLLSRVPQRVGESARFQQVRPTSMPRTLRELDDQVTAPLGGFRDVDDYYRTASAAPYLADLQTPTLLMTSADDPLIPIASFRDTPMSARVKTLVTRRGGHAGFIGRAGTHWMDDRLFEWFLSGRDD